MMKKAVIVCGIPFLLVKSKFGFHVQNIRTQVWLKVLIKNVTELEHYIKRL